MYIFLSFVGARVLPRWLLGSGIAADSSGTRANYRASSGHFRPTPNRLFSRDGLKSKYGKSKLVF